MLSNNNSNPAVCVSNLIKIARGEVPYDRVKGISSEYIYSPVSHVTDDLVDDVDWAIGTYEPRVELESVEVVPSDASDGQFVIQANINPNKENDDE